MDEEMEFSEQLAKLDKAVALDRLGGDEELLKEVAALFLDEYPTLMAEIEAAIQSKNAHQLERAAHSLKGSVSNFGSDAAYQAAYEIEKMGRANELANSETAFTHLVRVMEAIRPELTALASRQFVTLFPLT